MRRRARVAAVLMLVLVTLVAVGSWFVAGPGKDETGGRPAPGIWVMGYYVDYLRGDYPVEEMAWDSLTHIAVGVASPRPDGTVDAFDDLESSHWARRTVQEAHRHGVTAILMLGGAQSRDAFVSAASERHRHHLVEAVIATVEDFGFDGVDVDWEPMERTDGPAVLAVANELRERRPGLVLTAALGAVNLNQPYRTLHPFVPEMAAVFDRLNLMTYGLDGGWNGWESWHSSPLSGHDQRTPMSLESSVDAYLASGVPASRLGLGVGFFGTCHRGVTGPRQTARGMHVVGDDNAMSYSAIMRDYYAQSRSRWDDRARVPYLSSASPFGPLRCTYVSYEDERSIAAKAAYSTSKGLGGVIIWNLNLGHVRGSGDQPQDPLLDAVKADFLG